MGRNKLQGSNIIDKAFSCQEAGAGELIINQIDRDGCKTGLNIGLMKILNAKLTIPVVAMGGCGNISHINQALEATPLSGIAGSSIFVYATGTEKVLLKYSEIKQNIPLINNN